MTNEEYYSKTVGGTGNTAPHDSISDNKIPETTGNIYLNFDINKDDNISKSGRTFPGLLSQLSKIKKKSGNEFFDGYTNDSEIFSAFIKYFFPEGFPNNYYISNLSLNSDQKFICIRPQTIGPRLGKLLPRGRTLAIRGKLHYDRDDANNPVFWAQGILEMSHATRRPFERLISGTVFSAKENIKYSDKRENNLLNNEFISNLPLISAETQDNLKSWNGYLRWRQRLVQTRLVGIRYIDVKISDTGKICFLTVCKNDEEFEKIKKALRNEVQSYALDYSKNHWKFEHNNEFRGRGADLGSIITQKEKILFDKTYIENIQKIDMPWDSPFFSELYFDLPEEKLSEFERMREDKGNISEDDQDLLLEDYINNEEKSGFLSLSIAGDMALIARQGKDIQQLQDQSGYAPFLSSYLFNIKEANQPTNTDKKIISEKEWFQLSLNEPQKNAVQKMINTPDIGLVQGPPGTGKTTMIAEATLQYVRQKKNVLLVSQASLAVNNALERLPQFPEIRAIRLSYRTRRNERAHPYSKENALGTYYRSIATACESATLNSWAEDEKQQVILKKWIERYDLLFHDLNVLRSKRNNIETELSELENNLSTLKKNSKEANLIERRKLNIKQFSDFINGSNVPSYDIPEEILSAFFENITCELNQLSEHGIHIPYVWSQMQYGSVEERGEYAIKYILRWREILQFMQKITGDIDRLRSTNDTAVRTSGSDLELFDLEDKFSKIEKEMEDGDDSKIKEWRVIREKIQKLKSQATGLDHNLYSQQFNDAGEKMLRVFLSSQISRAEVIASLEKVNNIINDTAVKIDKGIKKVSQCIAMYIDKLPLIKIDEKKISKVTNNIRINKFQYENINFQLVEKENILSEVVKDNPLENSISGQSSDILRKLAEQKLSDLKENQNLNKIFRENWNEILNDWVNDLKNPDVVKSDQEYFFPFYEKACNIVGITCTENKQTLEDAGHNWFDVVIVDEVSKATPTEIIMPLMMAKTAILVGDHRQLPPLFKEQEGSWHEAVTEREESENDSQDPDSELNEQNFDLYKDMVTSSLFRKHFEDAPDSIKSFLFTQYRMHPQIMSAVNCFYENRLICGLKQPDEQRAHNLTLPGTMSRNYIVPDAHISWLDSSKDPFSFKHHERNDLGSSKVNELECLMIAKAVCDIEVACRVQGFGISNKRRKDVGVVTFYGRQVRALREAIYRYAKYVEIENFIAIDWDVNTVDRYQGQERSIILVSMVRNPTWKLSRKANTAQFERINVAFSRAQELLIIAGAADVFAQYPVILPHLEREGQRETYVYQNIIDEIKRNGSFWHSEDILSKEEYKNLLPSDYIMPSRKIRPQRFRKKEKGKYVRKSL